MRVEKVGEQGGEGTGEGGVVVQNEVGAGGGGNGSRMGTEGVQRGFRSKASTGRWRPGSEEEGGVPSLEGSERGTNHRLPAEARLLSPVDVPEAYIK